MNNELSVANLSASPGERVADTVRFTVAGIEIDLPLFLINGIKDGPTLVVTAGIHGAEYPCIEAAARLGRTLDPEQIAGQVIIAPMANPVAFKARSIYVTEDGKNLNRQFPGDANGTFSQRLAHWLFQQIIKQGDYYIDLHGGDMIEALMPFGCCVHSGNPALDEAGESMAIKFGLPYIVLKERRSIAGTTHMAATDAGIPSLLAEAGGQGLLTEEDVQRLTAGVHRVMHSLGISSDAPPSHAPPRRFDRWRWHRSEAQGLFFPTVRAGDGVKSGQDVGKIIDIFGNTLQSIQASMDGDVLFLVTSMAINPGDPLLAIAA